MCSTEKNMLKKCGNYVPPSLLRFLATPLSVSIKSTALAHSNILTHLLPAHVLTSCDTLSPIWGSGKSTVVKVLKSGLTSHKLRRMQEPVTKVISEATKFILACYGYAEETTMTNLRFKV